MKLIHKTFKELTTEELYELLKARAEIFVVGQECIYQDMDDTDYRSHHVFYQDDSGKVVAYLRIFQRDEDTVQMGRVLSIEHGIGLGWKVLCAGITVAKEQMKAKKIYIEAQTHAIGFYEKEGFQVCSEEFLEVGIPHVQMELEL